EKAVRYRLARLRSGTRDGRADKPFRAEAVASVIAQWMASHEGAGVNLQSLHELLVSDYGYTGSYKSVQRYVRAHFPRPKRRARRRVETPPGAQGQVDWGEFPRVRVGGEACSLHAFHLVLSHSRHEAVIWSERADELAWLDVHNRALKRLGGVPAVLRVDNCKTAMGRGAGPWGEVNEVYRRYARSLRFHVDATRPRQPQEKGKVERRILGHRKGFDPRREDWSSLEDLQAWTDEQVLASSKRRTCPVTGSSVFEAWQVEKERLGPIPLHWPEPFDLVQQRRVAKDATIRFEGRTYSVPFGLVGQVVEVHGCARTVQVVRDGSVVAEHPRRTRSRLLVDPRHYEGPSTDEVEAPIPLGRMGKRLQEIYDLAPEQRPLDLYAALAEVSR
ncbi:MAG TPA: IS21 family transposase, partial [Polyangiaceae bacterium]|nr:IS21 family transposase [Polyangiaceae bacterium]